MPILVYIRIWGIQGLEFGVNSSLNSLVTLDSGNLTIDSSLVNSLVPINTGVQNNLFIINKNCKIYHVKIKN